MVKFKGLVVSVADGMRDFADRDKDGNKLKTTTAHRVTEITLSVTYKNDAGKTIPVGVSFRGFDLPATFQLPQEGVEWQSPAVREYKQVSPLYAECRF